MSEQASDTSVRSEVLGFLGADFREAFNSLRDYDSRIWEVTKFSFLELLASIGAVWTIFTVANGEGAPVLLAPLWELVGGIILIVSFIFSFFATRLILRTRIYFVRTARYINAQRHFFFSREPNLYPNESQYYTRADKPEYFDPDSTELWSVYTIDVVSSFVFGFGIGLLANYFGMPEMPASLLGMAVWVLSAGGQIAYCARYLKKQEGQPAKGKGA